jgi:signal transduction histidine kinase
MTIDNSLRNELLAENKNLRLRLEEAEDTLRAIGSGEVDAFMVSGPDGQQIFTLKGTELPYRILVETMNEGAASLAADGSILFCNNRLAAMLQVPLEKLIGTQLGTYVARADHSLFMARLGMRSEECYKDEIIMITGKGNSVPVIISYCAPELSNSQGISVVVTDLTQQKRNEEDMAAELLARSIIEQAGEAIVVCDEDGAIIRASRLAHQLCGKNPLLKQFNELFQLRITDTYSLFSVLDPLRGVCFESAEIEFKRSDNKIFHLLLNATPLKNFHNNIIGCVVTLTDISERSRAEKEIERLNTDLTARAAELEVANRELEAFNYTVAHDLRNPLNAISSYCQAFKELCGGKLDERCMRYIREIYDGTLSMNRLIEALINFSRLMHTELNRELVDLSRMAKEIIEQLKAAVDARRVEIRIADGIVSNGDANLLRVVLTNLFDNAWKYTATREEGVIEFGVTEIDGKPVFWVRDNGNGFDMADVDKLFIPFQRLPGAEECRGFGVGLATVERIIRRHGGRIWAEGEPGKGATFYFTLSADESRDA